MADAGDTTIGPVRLGWMPYRHGAPAEPLARRWLAAELGVAAESLRVARAAHGRPHLLPPHDAVDAGWSHSGDGLLVAHARGVRLGVDLELLRPRPRALEIARRYFTAAEAGTLAALAGDAREQAFVALWCAKEAVLKADGRGLAFGLHRVGFARDDDAWRLVAADPALGPAAAWQVRAFAPRVGYLASVAWRGDAALPAAAR